MTSSYNYAMDLAMLNFAIYSTNAFEAHAVAVTFDGRHEFSLHHDGVRFLISLHICGGSSVHTTLPVSNRRQRATHWHQTRDLEIIDYRFIDHDDICWNFLLSLPR